MLSISEKKINLISSQKRKYMQYYMIRCVIKIFLEVMNENFSMFLIPKSDNDCFYHLKYKRQPVAFGTSQ